MICSFPDDIYTLADYLEKQDDIKLIKKKDYISHPKPNGYRSLHLILEVPIFLTNEKKMMRVEVQFRTIAMDFWASLEHKLKYKKDIDNAQVISQDLCFCAELISQLDGRMQQIRERLEEKKDDTQSNITGVDEKVDLKKLPVQRKSRCYGVSRFKQISPETPCNVSKTNPQDFPEALPQDRSG